MSIQVEIVAPFEVRGQARDGRVELPDGSSVRDLLRLNLNAPFYTRWLPVSVNGEQVPHGHILSDGDRVVFILPRVGG